MTIFPDDMPLPPSTATGEWRRRGSCRNHEPDIWFSEDRHAEAYAKNICSTCPVKMQCQDYVLEANEIHGTWGGLTAEERRRIRRKRRKMAAAL